MSQMVLVDRDPVDDTMATASLLRPDVKIVTQKGHSEEDVLLTGCQTCWGRSS